MTDRTAQLDHELIAALREAVHIPLVLHGSSGVADDELARAVSQGIVKVNVGTILNVAFTGAIRTHLDHQPHVVDPRKYLTPARDDLAAVVTRMIAAVAARDA
jgi:fructose-bisphosphate aldolase class II